MGIGGEPQVLDRLTDLGINDRSGRGWPGSPCPVGSRSDLTALFSQDPTHRFDREPLITHLINERNDQRLRGSNSPAKKTVAVFRIATSSRNRAFSAFSLRICSNSRLVPPPWTLHRPQPAAPTDATSPPRSAPAGHRLARRRQRRVPAPILLHQPQRTSLHRGINLLRNDAPSYLRKDRHKTWDASAHYEIGRASCRERV